MKLKHGGEALTSEFGRTLAAMSVKNGKAAVVAGSLEVVLNHELDKKIRIHWVSAKHSLSRFKL